jgi:hypothetical protein
MFTESGRVRKGAVGIESFRGRLRLRLPRQLFNGKQKYIYTGLADTSVNRKAVEAKVKLIESDIAFERFDYTLAKYGKPQSPHFTLVETIKPQAVGMAQELPKHRYQVNPNPNAFSEEERDRVIEIFNMDGRKGMNYRHYGPFVEFLFCVGCRPSEAIGLQWKHVSADCGFVNFESSLVQIGNRRVRSQGSKNNRTRRLAVSERVKKLLG